MIELFLYAVLVVVVFAVATVSCLIWVVSSTDKLKDNTFEGEDNE